MPKTVLAIRQLAEFLFCGGDIDSRFVGFDRALEGARIHRRLQKAAGEGYAAEVALAYECTAEGIEYRLEGRADGIFTDESGTVTIDEIKTTAAPCERITEDFDRSHWAQAMLYAAIYGTQCGLDAAAVRLTYFQVDEEKTFTFTRHFSIAELSAFLHDALVRYAPWAREAITHAARRGAGLSALGFPFAEWRSGQHAMAGEVFRTCCAPSPDAGGCLFCQAPTGIGKTMSTVYPALRAIGSGCGDKLFYLTARGTAGAAAEDALSRLHAAAPELVLRSITLAAKEKVCLCPNEAGRPECLPERCPYAKGYYDRIQDALWRALQENAVFSRAAVAALAEQCKVCPFEFGLDLSEWCDVIIGDYNYLFDPVVHLQRFFDASGDWLFLIDEAHNLPDRARDMYSAELSKSTLLEARRALGKGKNGLKTALAKANDALLAYRRAIDGGAEEEQAPESAAEQTSLFAPARDAGDAAAEKGVKAEPQDAAGDAAPENVDMAEGALFGGQTPLYRKGGTQFYEKLPRELYTALHRVSAPAQAWLEEHREGAAHETILNLYFALRDFLRTAEGYDSHYVTRFSAHGADLTVSLLCLDPSAFVHKSLACGRAAVLFSATLSPPGYYKRVLGCGDARAVALGSPFPPENLGLYCLSAVSTRYRDREASYEAVADALAAMANAKPGNYLAFFPSYQYLQKVHERFAQKYPELATLVQESGLDEAARADFLARFAPPAPGAGLLGFCVMGGVFGEGIDLAGERLIGCAVIGVGLPQVNPRQEMLREYFEKVEGCGFDFAYRYPGMNKVLQAAGRVIRTPEDKGVVLLIDDRFAYAEYRRLLPPHWAHLRCCASVPALKKELEVFWAQE